ncbi:hypothetical protein D9M71_532000 [compost metagenome]
MRFQQVQCRLGTTVLLQKQSLAEYQLAIVRVFLQQAIEALLQAVTGVLVGFGSRQGEEIEMGVAFALQHFLHVDHGVVVAAAACQLDGSSALRIEVVRSVFRPDQCGIQGGLIGAEVFGNAVGTLGNAGILGPDCLTDIVVQGYIKAIALAGQFRTQQVVHGFLGKRPIDHRLVHWLLCGIEGRRLGIRRVGGQGLAALEQGQGKE